MTYYNIMGHIIIINNEFRFGAIELVERRLQNVLGTQSFTLVDSYSFT